MEWNTLSLQERYRVRSDRKIVVKAQRPRLRLNENKCMGGIQFVTDEKGRKVAVQIDLKKYGAVL